MLDSMNDIVAGYVLDVFKLLERYNNWDNIDNNEKLSILNDLRLECKTFMHYFEKRMDVNSAENE